MTINELWTERILSGGADFVRFVDATSFSDAETDGLPCAVLFGKALSGEYLRAMRDDLPPKTKEVLNVERKMDALAMKIAEALENAGYRALGKLKTGRFPHKTVALRAGLGFIGKNNLLITPEYGCGVMLGKVLTDAPFEASYTDPPVPDCGDCAICAEVCPTGAILGTTWNPSLTREDIMNRKRCVLCLKCMTKCPYTQKRIQSP